MPRSRHEEILAIAKLLKAIEHIQLPMNLSKEQADTYNELMFAVAHVETVFNL